MPTSSNISSLAMVGKDVVHLLNESINVQYQNFPYRWTTQHILEKKDFSP